MNKYYQIVPVNDGYTYLCYSRFSGSFYLERKDMPKCDDALIFDTMEQAEHFMKVCDFEPNKYMVEEFWMS